MDHMDAVLETQTMTDIGFKSERWDTTRGLRRKSGETLAKNNEQYLDVLPTYKNKDLVNLLDEKTEDGQARYLDIGCGAGLEAIDVRELYPKEKLDIFVIGHPDDIKKPLSDPPRGIGYLPPTEQKLIDNNIVFNFLDFSKLTDADFAQLGQFDVITGCYSFDWIKDDKAKLIKNVQKLLKPEGVALIAPYDQTINYEIPNIELNHGGIAFQKTS